MPQPPSLDRALTKLREGVVLPAHPLALTPERKLDERRQRALTRYYCAAGAGGVAVGVHTTQFQIHDPKVGLYEPVLALAADTLEDTERRTGDSYIRVAGIVGPTQQAVREAQLAAELGFHLGVVSLGALADASDDELVEHLERVAEVIPLFGFYLQPAVGGRPLGYAFWRRACEIENLHAIKIAPFDRYQTLEVVRAVADSGRAEQIALYTGNDDAIVHDLVTPFRFSADGPTLHMAGGLLGQWAVWTRRAVELLKRVRQLREQNQPVPPDLLLLGQQLTDANAAIFDVRNGFRGCIPGIHEILHRQGLLAGRWTLDPNEDLSPGQLAEIERVCAAYPHLRDDAFVQEHLEVWLSP